MDDLPALTDDERAAITEVERASEWLQRARGDLVAFHHAVGRAMDHFADAEDELRAAGYDDLADRVRDDHLTRGVLDDGTWTYDLVEEFEDGFAADLTAFVEATRDEVADGARHVAERRLQRRWRERAED